MMKNLTIFLILITSIYSYAQADVQKYQTSIGAVFERANLPVFGDGWKSPDGTIWGGFSGDTTNLGPDSHGIILDSDAIQTCLKLNGTLPSAQDYQRFSTYFETDSFDGFASARGRKDLYSMFPDMLDSASNYRWFWTTTLPVPYNLSNAAILNTYKISTAGYVGDRSQPLSVRCITH